MAAMTDPLQFIRGTSSGTIGSLTGKTSYAEIDAVQAEWYNWLLDQWERSGRFFDNWTQAWNAFVDAHPEKEFKRWE